LESGIQKPADVVVEVYVHVDVDVDVDGFEELFAPRK
jgi:hypothetical protein